MSNRKDEGDKRTIWINSRYTPDEYRRVKKHAKSMNMTVSKYVRESALNNIDNPKNCPIRIGTYQEFKAHISEILSDELFQTDAGKRMIIDVLKASIHAGTEHQDYAISILTNKHSQMLSEIESMFRDNYSIRFCSLDNLVSFYLKYEKKNKANKRKFKM